MIKKKKISAPDVVRVLVGDSTRMGSQLLADALGRDTRFQVVSVCVGALEILEAVATCQPDVALVSANLDEGSLKGFEVSRKLSVLQSQVKVVMLFDTSKRDLVLNAFGAGARGIFCRAESIETLRKCIYSVHMGQVWANSEEMRFVLEAFVESVPPRLVDAKGNVLLSKREQDVVRCVTEGLTNREISVRLQLSEHTIKNYIFRIFDKLGVSTRVEMVLYVFSQRTPTPPAAALPDGIYPPANRDTEIDQCRRLAEEGFGLAQFKLGERYRDGEEVAADRVAAYMWFLIAEDSSRILLHRLRGALEGMRRQMAPDEVAEAQRRAAGWLENPSRVAHSDSAGVGPSTVRPPSTIMPKRQKPIPLRSDLFPPSFRPISQGK